MTTVCTIAATRMISIASVSTGQRFIEPKQSAIDAMAVSLQETGQLSPIMVHYQTRKTYRLVVGQTRFKAAVKLGWTKIRADIVAGSAIDYRIIEITENLNRHDLTATQRKAAKAEHRKLMQEKLAGIEPAKGGRGRKGGLAEAARQAGIPETTARREKVKPRQTTESGEVSEPAAAVATNGADQSPVAKPKPSLALGTMVTPLSIRMTVEERQRVQQYNQDHCGNGSLSDCLRALIREALAAHGYWPPTEDRGGVVDSAAPASERLL